MKKDLVIRLAYPFNFAEFKTLFPEIKLYEEREKVDIDLLVFPGGEDVSLEYYLAPNHVEKFREMCRTNRVRDEYEKKILFDAITEKTKVNKILGVCRGAQFLNVMFGGTLYPDINSFGIVHASRHMLMHHTKSNVSFINNVNSLHHQGIRICGEFIAELDMLVNSKVIATDTEMNVREIVAWLGGKILGVQYHPEYYAECEDKQKFRDFCYKWASDEINVY